MARTTGKWRDCMKNNADVTRIVTYTVGKWRFVVFSYFVSRCHGGIWPTLSKCFAFALYQPCIEHSHEQVTAILNLTKRHNYPTTQLCCQLPKLIEKLDIG